MVFVLIALSLLVLVVAALMLTQATAGAGLVGAACLFAILARIAQAKQYHREMMDQLTGRVPQPTEQEWICPQCRKPVHLGDPYCGECGAVLAGK